MSGYPHFGKYPEDGFFEKVAAQVTDNHRAVREANRRKREVWKQSPAMQIASNLIRGPFGLEPEGEAEFEEMLERMRDSLWNEPLLSRYRNHLGTHPVSARTNTEWWHALGHQYMTTVAWTLAQTRQEIQHEKLNEMPVVFDERLWQGNAFKDVGPRELAFEWAGRTLEAKTYLWHQNTLDAALAAPLVPHVVQPNALPFTNLFFSFEHVAFSEIGGLIPEEPSDIVNQEGKAIPYRAETWWMLLTALGDAGMMLIFDRQFWPTDHEKEYVEQQHHIFEPLMWGSRWPEDFESRPFRHEIGAALRMLAFMQAPFVDTTLMERKLPRPIRREYDRQGKEAPLKEVSIITLRAALYEPVYRNGQDESDGEGRKYTHSWWVNGHYRWQWYPSEKTHRLIAIAPYMKQIGKPLLPQIRDVSR